MQNRPFSLAGQVNIDPSAGEPTPNVERPARVADTAAREPAAAARAERGARVMLLGKFLGREEQRSFRSGGNRAFVVTAYLYAGILAAFAVTYFAVTHFDPALRLLTLALAFVWIGWSQFSLSNGLHEGLHRNFGEHQREWLTAVLTAYPIGLTLSGYRRIHFAHHRHFGDAENDPDFAEYSTFPKSRLQLLARFAWMGSGIPALRQFFRQILRRAPVVDNAAASTGAARAELLLLLAVQAVIFALIALPLGWIYYFALWVLPLATLGKLLSSTRLLCEHGTPDVAARGSYVIRTILGHGVRTNLLGVYRFNLHGEHHLYPSVPYAMLDSLQQRHAVARLDAAYAAELADGFECFTAGGYPGLLRLWFKQLPWTARP